GVRGLLRGLETVARNRLPLHRQEVLPDAADLLRDTFPVPRQAAGRHGSRQAQRRCRRARERGDPGARVQAGRCGPADSMSTGPGDVSARTATHEGSTSMQRAMMMTRSGRGHAEPSGWRSTEKLAAPDGLCRDARAEVPPPATRPVVRWEIPAGAKRPVMRWQMPTESRRANRSIAIGVLALVCGFVLPPAALGTGPTPDMGG